MSFRSGVSPSKRGRQMNTSAHRIPFGGRKGSVEIGGRGGEGGRGEALLGGMRLRSPPLASLPPPQGLSSSVDGCSLATSMEKKAANGPRNASLERVESVPPSGGRVVSSKAAKPSFGEIPERTQSPPPFYVPSTSALSPRRGKGSRATAVTERMSKSELYAWGNGEKILAQPRLLWGKKVKQVAAGGSHAAALLTTGEVYVWGDGRSGQLGLGDAVKSVEEPTRMDSLTRGGHVATRLWCGFAQTAVVTTANELFVCGYDSIDGPVFLPKKKVGLENELIVDLAFGPTVMAVIVTPDNQTARKSVYGPLGMSEVKIWGLSKRGVLGLGNDVTQQRSACTIPSLAGKGVSAISIGEYHATACTARGEVYVWGSNRALCLGVGSQEKVWKPVKVEFPGKPYIVEVMCGSNFTVAQTDAGEIYTWGRGRHGCLGHGTEVDTPMPKKVAMLPPVVGFSVGGVHTLAWTATNRIYSWGEGRSYKLGHDTEDDVLVPEPIDAIGSGKIIHSISCGFNRTLALLETDLVTVTYQDVSQSVPVTSDTKVADVLQRMAAYHKFDPKDMLLINERGVRLRLTQLLSEQASRENLIIVKKVSLWDEETEDLIFAKSHRTDVMPVVAAGTAEKLVEWLTFPVSTGFEYSVAFMLMHPNFISSSKLLERLMDRWKNPQLAMNTHESLRDATRYIIRLRVLNVIKKWIQEYGSEDFFLGEEGVEIVERLWAFIEREAMVDFSREATGLRRLLISKLETYDTQVRSATSGSLVINQSLVGAPMPDTWEHSGPMSVFKYSAREFARQFTLIDFYEFLQKLKAREFIAQAWNKKDKQEKAPSIIRMIQRFNNVSQWVAAEILRGQTHGARVQKTERFIEIASHARKLHNFNLIMCFLSAFNSSPIHRLKSIWGEHGISQEHKETLVFLKKLMQVDHNMAAYREYYENVMPPKIPFIGIHLQDYTFLDDANPTEYPADPRLINFTKCLKLSSTVNQVLDFQRFGYMLKPQEEIIEYLLGACGFENHERAAFNFSRLIEPPEGGDVRLCKRVMPPPVLSEDVSKLYAMHSGPVVLEGPEIRLLNQRVGIMLAQVNQETQTADRQRLWSILCEKLKADTESASKETDKARMSFKEILLSSRAVDASLLSALIQFPQNEELESFTMILEETLFPFVDLQELLSALALLGNCQLLPEQAQLVARVFACYKDVEAVKRKDISKRKEQLEPLKVKANEAQKNIRRSRANNERRGTVEQSPWVDRTYVDMIQCYYRLVKLIQELHAEYEEAVTYLSSREVVTLCPFLLDVKYNTKLRQEAAKDARDSLMTHSELEQKETKSIIEREEARIASLRAEEKQLLKELDSIEAELQETESKAAGDLHLANYYQSAWEEDEVFLEGKMNGLSSASLEATTAAKALKGLQDALLRFKHTDSSAAADAAQEMEKLAATLTPIVAHHLKNQTGLYTFVLATSRSLKNISKSTGNMQSEVDLASETENICVCKAHILSLIHGMNEFLGDGSDPALRKSVTELAGKLFRLSQLIHQVKAAYAKLNV